MPSYANNSPGSSSGGCKELCLHVLFVMMKVLRVPPSNPLVWQLYLNGTPAPHCPHTSVSCCPPPESPHCRDSILCPLAHPIRPLPLV